MRTYWLSKKMAMKDGKVGLNVEGGAIHLTIETKSSQTHECNQWPRSTNLSGTVQTYPLPRIVMNVDLLSPVV
jgi:hypothetical protein